jgi:hypothetical protein
MGEPTGICWRKLMSYEIVGNFRTTEDSGLVSETRGLRLPETYTECKIKQMVEEIQNTGKIQIGKTKVDSLEGEVTYHVAPPSSLFANAFDFLEASGEIPRSFREHILKSEIDPKQHDIINKLAKTLSKAYIYCIQAGLSGEMEEAIRLATLHQLAMVRGFSAMCRERLLEISSASNLLELEKKEYSEGKNE